MAQRVVTIPELGQITLAKRRNSTHLRLSVTSRGTVRVGMPYWLPYAAGIKFAQDRKGWIAEQMAKHTEIVIKHGMRIGKSHRLSFEEKPSISAKITGTEVVVGGPKPFEAHPLQSKARQAAEKALKIEAQRLLPQRLAQLAAKHGYNYREVKVRRLTSRWGSCSSNGVITLSYYLMQLPWRLIDYVLLHELLHTKHMHHGAGFWQNFEAMMPGAKKMRKEINAHRPRVEPYDDIPARTP